MGVIVLAAVGITVMALAGAGWRALRDLISIEERAGAAVVHPLTRRQAGQASVRAAGRPRLRLVEPPPAA